MNVVNADAHKHVTTPIDENVETPTLPSPDPSRLDDICRDALGRYRRDELRWVPAERYLAKPSYTANDARILARHLMRKGFGSAYEDGIAILEAAGEPDLETIIPLHGEAMTRHRATCLWHAAPTASWTGLAAIATALRTGGMEANQLAEKIERTMRARCL